MDKDLSKKLVISFFSIGILLILLGLVLEISFMNFLSIISLCLAIGIHIRTDSKQKSIPKSSMPVMTKTFLFGLILSIIGLVLGIYKYDFGGSSNLFIFSFGAIVLLSIGLILQSKKDSSK